MHTIPPPLALHHAHAEMAERHRQAARARQARLARQAQARRRAEGSSSPIRRSSLARPAVAGAVLALSVAAATWAVLLLLIVQTDGFTHA